MILPWVASWRIIDRVAVALVDGGRSAPTRREVGSGGLDFAGLACEDALLIDLVPSGPTRPSTATDLPEGCCTEGPLNWTAKLYLVRSCVPRGINPETKARAAESGSPSLGFDPCSWAPEPDTWHGGQLGLLADLEAVWKKASVIQIPSCDRAMGMLGACTTARAANPTPYNTGIQGTVQGWLIPFQITANT